MSRPAVIIVGADKGGVGKTTVSRTLLDYLEHKKIPARAFDTESPGGTLKHFHTDKTDVVDMTRVPDQMKVFDYVFNKLDDPHVTLIDVRAGIMTQTLQILKDIGFLQATKEHNVPLAVFHILGPSRASLNEIEDTAKFTNDARYFLVKNFISNQSKYFQWNEDTYNSYFNRVPGAEEIQVPTLNERAAEEVELASMPFLSFTHDRKHSFVLRGYVGHWLTEVWKEYERVKLADIINPHEGIAVKTGG